MLIAYLRCMGHTPSSKVDCIENGFPLLGCADDLFFSTGQKTHHSLGESREYVFYFWGGSAVANPR
jgi:hypothetical protein